MNRGSATTPRYLVTGTRGPHRMSGRDLEERLLSYLRDHPGSGPREIADALGEPLQRVRLALARLRDRGLVARGEEGRYYAVAHLVKGIGRGDVRRGRPRRLGADLEAVAAALEELRQRLEEVEERLRRLEEQCREIRRGRRLGGAV